MTPASSDSRESEPIQENLPAVALCEEAAPQTYRKVSLNGRPLCDPEPWQRLESDQELEQTCVDALTLQLRHQTTDIYVPLLKGDFALSVTRNAIGAAWLSDGEIAPADRPDLPFGNCWTSGVAASIHVVDRGEREPTDVYATDEQGTVHRFVALFEAARCAGYHPLPSAQHEQESGAMSLERDAEANWVFRRKFGTTLVYDRREIVREVRGRTGETEWHRYHPLISATDSRGVGIRYVFHSGNDGLIPDEITFQTRSIRIERDPAGCVNRLIDPRGNDFLFRYRQPTLPGGAPLLVAIERPAVLGARRRIIYGYDETPERSGGDEPAAFHTNLSRITDANGYTHEMEYAFDRSRIEVAGGVDRPAAGMPRCVCKTILPAGLGAASFINYSAIYPDSARRSRRITLVADAEGNGRIYHFVEPSLISLSGLSVQPTCARSGMSLAPRLSVFRGLRITHCRGSRHRLAERKGEVRPAWPSRVIARETYEFDLEAGMALAKAIDLSGNVTKFLHEEERVAGICGVNPFSVKHADPTARINALGGARRFKYDPLRRSLVEREDELGRVTTFTREPEHGGLLAEATYESREALARLEPFALTEFQYGDARFPAFATRKIVRKLPRPGPTPAWEQDLVTDFEADYLGQIVLETRDPDGLRRVTRFAYDESGNKLSHQYPNGFFIQFRYDALNRLVRIYRPRQNPERIYFDVRGNKVREVASNGEVTLHEWDAVSNLVRNFTGADAEAGIKGKEPFQYNAVGSMVFNPSVEGQSRTLKYDALQRVVSMKYGAGWPVRFAYRRNCGSLLFKESAMEATSGRCRGWGWVERDWKYDACNRKIEDGVLRRRPAFFKYDAVGNLLLEVDANGNWTRHEYDPLNRRVKTILPDGTARLTLHTSTGLEYGSTNAQGDFVEKRYDAAGEPIEEER
jgi:YD repeat-containing protein